MEPVDSITVDVAAGVIATDTAAENLPHVGVCEDAEPSRELPANPTKSEEGPEAASAAGPPDLAAEPSQLTVPSPPPPQQPQSAGPGPSSKEGSVASWIDAVHSGAVDAAPEATLAEVYASLTAEDEQDKEEGTKNPQRSRRKGGGKSGAEGKSSSSRAKRSRSDATAAAEDEALRAFRRSQRSLRKEAKGLSLQDALSRSAMPFSPTSTVTAATANQSGTGFPSEPPSAHSSFPSHPNGYFSAPPGATSGESNPFSPTGGGAHSLLSPSSPSGATSSPWSPALVSDITNSFLATVQQQKRQVVERLVPIDRVTGGIASRRVHSPSSSRQAAVASNTGAADAAGQNGIGRRTPRPPGGNSTRNTTSVNEDGAPRAPVSASLTASVMEELLGVEQNSLGPETEKRIGWDPLVTEAPLDDDDKDEEDDDDDDLTSEEELVIGDVRENEEDMDVFGGAGLRANHFVSHASEHSRRLRELSTSFDAATFARENSSSIGLSSSLPPTGGAGGSSLGVNLNTQDEASQKQELQWKAEEEQERARARAATRRQEIWKLQQRNQRAQRLLAKGSGAEAGTKSTSGATAPKPSSTAAQRTSSSASSTGGAHTSLDQSVRAFEAEMQRQVSASGSGSVFPESSTAASAPGSALHGLGMNQGGPSSPTGLGLRKGASIRDANLSASDISMIVRVNSFDRTSSQKIVVFGTASSAAKDKS